MPEVVVVGAGHSGLLCAVRLAEAGMPVTVLEASGRPGGAVASAVQTVPGFVHDDCAGFFPMTLASPAFAGLRERISWVNPEIAMVHPFPDGSAIALHRDLDATAASLEAAAVGAGGAWRELMAPLLDECGKVLGVAFTDAFPPLRDGLALALAFRRGALVLARRMLASTAAAGGELFRDEGATAWLAGSAAHGGLGPGAAGGAALAIGLKFLAHAVGWGFPAGGAQRITDVLVERLAELGGQIRCGAPVESVLVRGARTCGVRVQGGEEIAAPAVVLAISASAARRLLPDDGLPGRLMRRLETWRHALGTVKADYALSGPVPWTSHEARRSAVVHVAGELGEIFAAHEEARAGGLPDRPVLIVGQHSLHDDSRAPAGGHTLYVYTHVPGDGSFTRQEAAASIETQLERFAPGFRSLILKRALRLPGDLERENASLVGGDLTGGSCELDQQLIFRPAPELFRGRTPLRGLYLAGSSIHPGPGVHGVSGAAAARALLADRRPLRRLARGALGSRRSAD